LFIFQELVMLSKASVLAALGGLSVLAATGGAAQAQCVPCGYTTYYQPVTVLNCERLVPVQVLQPVVIREVVPVVSYRTVRRTKYVPRTYHARQPAANPSLYVDSASTYDVSSGYAAYGVIVAPW
jgi:hypothetical protein